MGEKHQLCVWIIQHYWQVWWRNDSCAEPYGMYIEGLLNFLKINMYEKMTWDLLDAIKSYIDISM